MKGEKNTAPKNMGLLIGIIVAAAVIILGVGAVLFFKLSHMLPEEVAISAVKNEFDQLIGYDEENSSPLIKEIHSGFDVEVKKVTKKGDEYIVTCVLSNYDMKQAMETMDAGFEMTLKEYTELFANHLKGQKKVTFETKLVIVKEKDGYRAFFTEEQLNAATGGLIGSYKSMYEEVSK